MAVIWSFQLIQCKYVNCHFGELITQHSICHRSVADLPLIFFQSLELVNSCKLEVGSAVACRLMFECKLLAAWHGKAAVAVHCDAVAVGVTRRIGHSQSMS